MVTDLTAKTGCRAAPLAENSPERAVYWVERRRRRAANHAALHVLEDALTDLFSTAARPGSPPDRMTRVMTGVFLDCYQRQQISPEIGLDPSGLAGLRCRKQHSTKW
jgi:hypothetical protein